MPTMQVTKRALIQRLNRKLSPLGKRVKSVRGAARRADVGAHYLINEERNILLAKNVDLEGLGRDLQVLMPNETAE